MRSTLYLGYIMLRVLWSDFKRQFHTSSFRKIQQVLTAYMMDFKIQARSGFMSYCYNRIRIGGTSEINETCTRFSLFK